MNTTSLDILIQKWRGILGISGAVFGSTGSIRTFQIHLEESKIKTMDPKVLNEALELLTSELQEFIPKGYEVQFLRTTAIPPIRATI